MVKIFKKKYLLQNWLAGVVETWYTAAVTWVLPSLFNDDPRLTFFAQRSNLVLDAFVWETVNWWIIEKLLVYDIEVDIYSKLNEYMEIYMYQRSRSFFDLFSKITHISLISNSFCPEATGPTEVQLQIEPSCNEETPVYQNSSGHMTKMATMPIYDKNL